MRPDPVWPVLALAALQLVDAVLCLGPIAPFARCLDDVHFPRPWWWTLPVVKSAAGVGLVAGIWIPGLGLLTGAALVLYFLIAISMHVRARDYGRNVVNATGMLGICVAVTVFSFLV